MRSVNINTPSTATSATNKPIILDIPLFSAVAVPKSSATSTATTATKILNTHLYEGRKQHEMNAGIFTQTVDIAFAQK